MIHINRKLRSSFRKKLPVVNLRSTNGGGKSYCVFGLFKRFGRKPIHNKKTGKVIAYRLKGTNVVVIGRYETDCGGCDQIHTQDDACNIVRKFAKKNAVLFEGLLISGIYARYLELSKELGGVTWAYLDTPLKRCYKNINNRRANVKGRDIQMTQKTKDNVKHKFDSVLRTKAHAIADKQHVVSVDHKHSAKQVARLLGLEW